MKRYLCPFPGCLAFVDTMGRYCSKHSNLQAEKDARIAAHNAERWERGPGAAHRWVYQDKRWRRLRAEHLANNPTCVMCGAEGRHIDHITPHRGNEDMAFDPFNLQTLCAACHAQKTAASHPNAKRGQP